jgi:hypothetical protein
VSAEQWRERFQALIREAKADRYELFIQNECCGCERLELRVCPEGWGYDESALIVRWPE